MLELLRGAVWTPERVQQYSGDFEEWPSAELLRWAAAEFSPGLALATGFGPEGVVLMHLVAQVSREISVFYLDTGLLFDETYALRDALAARLGLRFTRIAPALSLDDQARAHGPRLWARDPDRCCALRKVAPLRAFLQGQRAWITAIRREQTPQRAHARVLEWDAANGLVKLNPLAAWTSDQVWDHIRAHDLPYNPLHDQGFPSLGCWPCTQPVAPGADPRSGRWPGRAKTECGIHLSAVPLSSF
jgi:phosphoadenosine phosphosulfate reductase